jgi:dihydroorotate dehydrogenase (NAD+) catalytic subunit
VNALEVRIGSLVLKNPVLVASGTFGSGVEASDVVDLSRLGGVVTKSVTTARREGNPPPRIFETASGMLNSIGIQNPGLEGWIREVLPAFRDIGTARIVNVAGESVEDFERLCAAFAREEGIDALELNVSCPNVANGLDFGVDPALLEPLVARCRRVTRLPLIVKLTPNVADVQPPAKAAERGGADAVSLINTFVGLAIDWRKRVPQLGSRTGTGGLSGPAIKPLALHAVRQAAQAVKIPVIGIGGIRSADDVMEFVVAGAAAVQVGTQNFVDPGAAATIVARLEEWVRSGLVPSISAFRGTLRSPRPERS